MSKGFARFASWIIYLLEFLIAFLVVGVVLWRQETFRIAVMRASDKVVDASVRAWPSLATVLHSELSRWMVFGILAFAGAMLFGAVLRVLARRSTLFLMTWNGLRFAANTATILSSIWFGIFFYTILFKDFAFLGYVVREAYDPVEINFWMGIELAVWCFVYVLVQCTPFLFRPNLNVYWSTVDTLLSMLVMLVIGAGLFQYWFNPNDIGWWTPYRLATLILGGMTVLIDIILAFARSFFLIRGYIGEDTTAFGVH